jgi:hypothetical protein
MAASARPGGRVEQNERRRERGRLSFGYLRRRGDARPGASESDGGRSRPRLVVALAQPPAQSVTQRARLTLAWRRAGRRHPSRRHRRVALPALRANMVLPTRR